MSTPTTTTPLVEVRGLHTYYGNSHVLHGIDLQIAPGETLALLGRNGVGKSTTIRSLLGLTPARSGEVRIRGEDLTGSAAHKVIRRGIGYVPEGRGMFPNLTVRESLVMAARAGLDGRRDWDLQRVLETFPRLGERFAHLTGNLSGGEQQMVAIGRALMTNPELMILDEATEGLAPLIRKEIWAVIRLIKASGIATLVVDKNVNVLLDLTDRSMIMVKGRVMYDGPSQALKGQPEILQAHIGL
ncbi:ABC transporter ATP-binding protein [Pseudomonas sp. ALS1279]|jgi:branched-chain amino acid transport system ATP-binding protein|uniref:Amino acid/amide ABC transporter ATP-binding protein 2, HAAT family n=1 Tax=Pseudomonas sihuiensis TaxID=1274359 RepID=A0A1H2MBQ8_9PSED|nr:MULTISPECIES: ABC transporter ATP-binding protein [Pseudomonas]TRO43350.1 ABC transporter ATP-binding protein [Pseudomonas sp. ALS1279]SDU90378.1 amino acid/amide ABC transporter ATP-binding protein 2, HAAT family [Pseudomonas sihuiensis]